jgi:hypothetical protein
MKWHSKAFKQRAVARLLPPADVLQLHNFMGVPISPPEQAVVERQRERGQ